MKYLILLLIIVSCGKHSEPEQMKFPVGTGPSIAPEAIPKTLVEDKDTVPLVVTVENINATMSFAADETRAFEFTNNIDVKKYSKDLLVKNQILIDENNYLSQYSSLRIKSPTATVALNGPTKFMMVFPKVQSIPKALFLVSNDKTVKLGKWSQRMDFVLEQNDLESLLLGKSFLSLSYESNKLESKSPAESYRVFFHDGEKMQVHYISEEFSLSRTLKQFESLQYKFIEKENLLTFGIKSIGTEWWARENKNDFIISKENLGELSSYYLTGFQLSSHEVLRVNGFSKSRAVINKIPHSRVLLRIRVKKRIITDYITTRSISYPLGLATAYLECIESTRIASEEVGELLDKRFLSIILNMNGKNLVAFRENGNLRMRSDALGTFWELELIGEGNFQLNVDNLPDSSYLPYGVFQIAGCREARHNAVYRNNLQTDERSLKFSIEAFVEDI